MLCGALFWGLHGSSHLLSAMGLIISCVEATETPINWLARFPQPVALSPVVSLLLPICHGFTQFLVSGGNQRHLCHTATVRKLQDLAPKYPFRVYFFPFPFHTQDVMNCVWVFKCIIFSVASGHLHVFLLPGTTFLYYVRVITTQNLG